MPQAAAASHVERGIERLHASACVRVRADGQRNRERERDVRRQMQDSDCIQSIHSPSLLSHSLHTRLIRRSVPFLSFPQAALPAKATRREGKKEKATPAVIGLLQRGCNISFFFHSLSLPLSSPSLGTRWRERERQRKSVKKTTGEEEEAKRERIEGKRTSERGKRGQKVSL